MSRKYVIQSRLYTPNSFLDTVSTTCGSRWVRRRLRNISKPSASTTYPPATAGGTDCVQVRSLLLEAGLRHHEFVGRFISRTTRYTFESGISKSRNRNHTTS